MPVAAWPKSRLCVSNNHVLEYKLITCIPLAMRLCRLENAFSEVKVGQADLVLGMHQGSLVGLCMQYYKSLCAAVTICFTLVNIQTHTDSILTSLYE